jgi:hypothetical protein
MSMGFFVLVSYFMYFKRRVSLCVLEFLVGTRTSNVLFFFNIFRSFSSSRALSLPLSPRHYWDYTREAGADLAWDNSPVFGDQWFGSNAPANGDHVVDTGRFAYTPVTPTLQLLFFVIYFFEKTKTAYERACWCLWVFCVDERASKLKEAAFVYTVERQLKRSVCL